MSRGRWLGPALMPWCQGSLRRGDMVPHGWGTLCDSAWQLLASLG